MEMETDKIRLGAKNKIAIIDLKIRITNNKGTNRIFYKFIFIIKICLI